MPPDAMSGTYRALLLGSVAVPRPASCRFDQTHWPMLQVALRRSQASAAARVDTRELCLLRADVNTDTRSRRPARAARRGDLDHAPAALRRCELAAELVERRGPLLALRAPRAWFRTRSVSPLITTATRNMTTNVTGVPKIRDREREERRDEEEVERCHAQEGGEDRGREPVAARDQHDAEQVGHDHVGQLIAAEEPARRRRSRAPHDEPPRRSSGRERGGTSGALRGTLRPRLAIARRDVHVDVAALAHDLGPPARRESDRESETIAGLPTMILVMLRSRANRRISSLASSPDSVTTSAPSCSASRRFCESARLGRFGSRARAARLDVHGEPARVQSAPPCGAPRASSAPSRGSGSRRRGADRRSAQVCSMPWARRYALHLRVDALGRVAQRELAQRDQVALPEEVLDRALRPAPARTPCPRAGARAGRPAAGRRA